MSLVWPFNIKNKVKREKKGSHCHIPSPVVIHPLQSEKRYKNANCVGCTDNQNEFSYIAPYGGTMPSTINYDYNPNSVWDDYATEADRMYTSGLYRGVGLGTLQSMGMNTGDGYTTVTEKMLSDPRDGSVAPPHTFDQNIRDMHAPGGYAMNESSYTTPHNYDPSLSANRTIPISGGSCASGGTCTYPTYMHSHFIQKHFHPGYSIDAVNTFKTKASEIRNRTNNGKSNPNPLDFNINGQYGEEVIEACKANNISLNEDESVDKKLLSPPCSEADFWRVIDQYPDPDRPTDTGRDEWVDSFDMAHFGPDRSTPAPMGYIPPDSCMLPYGNRESTHEQFYGNGELEDPAYYKKSFIPTYVHGEKYGANASPREFYRPKNESVYADDVGFESGAHHDRGPDVRLLGMNRYTTVNVKSDPGGTFLEPANKGRSGVQSTLLSGIYESYRQPRDFTPRVANAGAGAASYSGLSQNPNDGGRQRVLPHWTEPVRMGTVGVPLSSSIDLNPKDGGRQRVLPSWEYEILPGMSGVGVNAGVDLHPKDGGRQRVLPEWNYELYVGKGGNPVNAGIDLHPQTERRQRLLPFWENVILPGMSGIGVNASIDLNPKEGGRQRVLPSWRYELYPGRGGNPALSSLEHNLVFGERTKQYVPPRDYVAPSGQPTSNSIGEEGHGIHTFQKPEDLLCSSIRGGSLINGPPIRPNEWEQKATSKMGDADSYDDTPRGYLLDGLKKSCFAQKALSRYNGSLEDTMKAFEAIDFCVSS